VAALPQEVRIVGTTRAAIVVPIERMNSTPQV
jgi:hypothetical protein